MLIRRKPPAPPARTSLLRVAAYARVSVPSEAMHHSLASQVEHYQQMIELNPSWILADIYTDEGITGTKSTRPGFQRLLADCRAGRIDLILTKSLSRFARNTVTLLQTIRELKDLGVDIYFEKENIHTVSAEGELVLTLIASVAQAESESVSENLRWRIKRKYEQGQGTGRRMYGFVFHNLTYSIVPEEAKVVRRIFDLYLSGHGVRKIANTLNSEGVPTLNGKRWAQNTIYRMLKNEKYVGDLMLQKYYVTDPLSKTKIRNDGARTQYYVRDDHPGIVDRETFEAVQELLRKKGEEREKVIRMAALPCTSTASTIRGAALNRTPIQGATLNRTPGAPQTVIDWQAPTQLGMNGCTPEEQGTALNWSSGTGVDAMLTCSPVAGMEADHPLPEAVLSILNGRVLCGICGRPFAYKGKVRIENYHSHWVCKRHRDHRDKCSSRPMNGRTMIALFQQMLGVDITKETDDVLERLKGVESVVVYPTTVMRATAATATLSAEEQIVPETVEPHIPVTVEPCIPTADDHGVDNHNAGKTGAPGLIAITIDGKTIYQLWENPPRRYGVAAVQTGTVASTAPAAVTAPAGAATSAL